MEFPSDEPSSVDGTVLDPLPAQYEHQHENLLLVPAISFMHQKNHTILYLKELCLMNHQVFLQESQLEKQLHKCSGTYN